HTMVGAGKAEGAIDAGNMLKPALARGKPILDRIIMTATTLEGAARCAMVSLDSTMRVNLSVGAPLELAIYRADSLEKPIQSVFELQSPFIKSLQKSWGEGLQRAFKRLPRFDWENSQ
ncbi:MAG: hypothetical protein KKG92_05210, partial [Gammaproteobacteria bacterium]|nr:hypothetical protein [Gammaproteobacteria bacterium]